MPGLTLRQEKFVQALTTPNTPTFCRPTAAYRSLSPDIVPGAQAVGAHRIIKNDKVSHAIRGQLGMEQLGRKLKKCLRETEKLKDWSQVRETVMDYAKLTGQLVEKREITTSLLLSPLVRRLLAEVPSFNGLPVAADAHVPLLTDAEPKSMTGNGTRDSDAEPSATTEQEATPPPHPTAGGR